MGWESTEFVDQNIIAITFDRNWTQPGCNGSRSVVKIANVEGFFATGYTLGTLNEHFTFLWSNGATTTGFSYATVGIYAMTVTEKSTGCSVVMSET